MKYSLLFVLILSACSSHSPQLSERHLASRKMMATQSFELSLSQNLVVANGVNRVQLKIITKDENGNLLSLDPSEIEIVTSIETKLSKIIKVDQGLQVSITPKIRSPKIQIFVTTKDSQSQTIVLNTTIQPLKDKLIPLPWGPSNNSTIGDVNYNRQDTFPEGQYEGFGKYNNGKNRIVNAQDSNRSFSFDFEEQARQNLSMNVQDAPNGTTSHIMLSHFILFPRLIIPYAEEQTNGELLVTLTNGEEVRFNKSGEIIGGVFEEGPVDIGPDRFKRTYANLKYQGKGILLRANARGQMPQQGQFESTKIDMEYGIKYSADVLIINGTTGERCRRPKKDFWSDADVTPIQFKFPTDAEFNTYLKQNCKFGIPELAVNTDLELENDDSIVRSREKFKAQQDLFVAKQKENASVDSKMAAETSSIRPKLLNDTSWVSSANDAQIKEDCLKRSLSLNTLVFQFNNSAQLMRPSLVIACSSIKNDLEIQAQEEVKNLIEPLSLDLAWLDLSNGQNFAKNCQLEFSKRYTNLKFKNTQGLYTPALTEACSKIENSDAFKTWLSTQTVAVENTLFLGVQAALALSTEATAQECVEEYPMNSALNRLRYKKLREACLIEAWPDLEAKAIAEAKRDPIALKVGVSAANLIQRLDRDRRINQLKLIKKYFIQ